MIHCESANGAAMNTPSRSRKRAVSHSTRIAAESSAHSPGCSQTHRTSGGSSGSMSDRAGTVPSVEGRAQRAEQQPRLLIHGVRLRHVLRVGAIRPHRRVRTASPCLGQAMWSNAANCNALSAACFGPIRYRFYELHRRRVIVLRHVMGDQRRSRVHRAVTAAHSEFCITKRHRCSIHLHSHRKCGVGA
jgi:hypothetical protein